MRGGLATRIAIACATTALAFTGFAAQAPAKSANHPVHPCQRLASVLAASPDSVHLPIHEFKKLGPSWSCAWTSKPGETETWAVLLYFLPSRSATLAHTNFKQLFDGAQAGGKAPSRIQLRQADEAFDTPDSTSNGTNNGYVAWRRGRYWGWLGVSMPVPGLAGLHTRDLVKRFLDKLPRT
jgi:hypothetical protein